MDSIKLPLFICTSIMKTTTKAGLMLMMAILLALPLSAQNAFHRWGFGVGYAFRDFQGIPNGEPNQSDLFDNPAFRLHLGRYLNPSLDVALATTIRPKGGEGIRDLVDADLSLQYKFNNGYLLKETAAIGPYLFGGIGMNALDLGNFSPNAYAPIGVGIKLWGSEPATIDINTAYKADLSGNLQDYFTVNAGVILNFGRGRAPKEEPEPVVVIDPDRDGDGIVDAMDDCPDTPGLPALKGCPDRDGDGIMDKADNCPDVAGVAENQGCPADADKDGVADTDDACPDVPGLASMAGCPDTDGDGIANPDDDCPDLAGTRTFNGCPDTDGDGIKDLDDKCPEEAGTVELLGCPEVAEEVIEKLEFATKSVQFETGSAVLKKTSYAVLDTVVSILNQYPQYSLRASGHTDSVGEALENQELSEKRAKACIDYLTTKGISVERLVSIGYGESQPIADNINAAGRSQNRRVEFDLFVK